MCFIITVWLIFMATYFIYFCKIKDRTYIFRVYSMAEGDKYSMAMLVILFMLTGTVLNLAYMDLSRGTKSFCPNVVISFRTKKVLLLKYLSHI